ncbi:MAG TPA: TetR/AcrR family transcriptional regulator [Methylocystis sp.]|nr:TetR/AcrR family transcriptional regulator [Methylocystis sp.]
MTDEATGVEPKQAARNPKGKRDEIVDALLRLAARRSFADITISDIAREAHVSLADFRDSFPSKGAALASFWRRIDREVLDHLSAEHDDEPSRERLYHVLAARLKALEPYRDAVLAIRDWAEKEPLSAAALNREAVNSMRFMLEAADIDSEGPVGALKLQGLAFAWTRVLDAWREDQRGETHRALSALDRELSRGERYIDRAEDLARLAAPFTSLAGKLFEGVRGGFKPARKSRDSDDGDHPHAEA